MANLKLFALDNEDLDVISAHLQDAVGRVGDVVWLPAERRFVMALNRFDWTEYVGKAGENQRRRTALHFERVDKVLHRGLRQDNPDAVLNLLTVRFQETDAPAGVVELVFSGGAAIRLEVECLEGCLADLGPAWSTVAVPAHELVPAAGEEA